MNYQPAGGDWQTISRPLHGKRLRSLTLILAEPGAGTAWSAATTTYEFDRIWVELQNP